MGKRIVRVGVWLVILGGIGFLVAGQLGSRAKEAKAPEKREPQVIAVTSEPLRFTAIQRSVRALGTIAGKEDVPISTKVEGRVLRIHKEVGDIVRPGDLLLELDPIDCQLAVNEAKRALELELSRIGLKEMPASFEVTKVPGVVRALALESLALTRKERAMKATSSMSADERQQCVAEYDVAKSNTRQAMLEAESTLATARQRQAVVESLTQKLIDTRLYAPQPSNLDSVGKTSATINDVEYVVSRRGVSEGEMVRILPAMTSSSLFQLTIDRPLKLMLPVPERHRPEIEPGQTVELEVETRPKQKFLGSVLRIHPAVEKSSRTFQVEVRIPNDDRKLSPGSFARASILTRLDEEVAIVPEQAVVHFAGVTKVFVQDGEVAREMIVETGISKEIPDGERTRTFTEIVPVKGAMPKNALIITSGQSQLSDGVPVRLRSKS